MHYLQPSWGSLPKLRDDCRSALRGLPANLILHDFHAIAWGRLVTCGALSKRPCSRFPAKLSLWLQLRGLVGQVANLRADCQSALYELLNSIGPCCAAVCRITLDRETLDGHAIY